MALGQQLKHSTATWHQLANPLIKILASVKSFNNFLPNLKLCNIFLCQQSMTLGQQLKHSIATWHQLANPLMKILASVKSFKNFLPNLKLCNIFLCPKLYNAISVLIQYLANIIPKNSLNYFLIFSALRGVKWWQQRIVRIHTIS